ncbi:hypothetical protein Tco_0797882 [Tanacetum coccineum]
MGFNFKNTKIILDNESTIAIVKNPVYHSKTKHIAIRHHFIRDAYEKKLIQVLKIHTDDNVADLLTKAFDVSRGLIELRESFRKVIDGTAALPILTLFILWLNKIPIRNLSKLHSYLQALISLLTTISLSTTMAVLDSCPKHNMVAYLEKSEGNAEFHEIIDFLKRSSIHHALTVSPVVSTTFVEQFWTSAKGKSPLCLLLCWYNQLRMRVFLQKDHLKHNLQPTPSPTPTSEVPHETQPDSSPAHTSEVPLEQQTDPSPRPSPSPIIPDSIPETSGGNLGGHSSSDKSLSGNEGEMTLQSVYDLCLSLCAQVSDQAKEIQHLKAQIKKLKKQAKPAIHHHRAWLKNVSLKQRLIRKNFPKKQRVHKESISKQGRKFAKGEPSVQRDPLFDELPEDTVDHMETENAQDVGRTREIVDEEKEIDEDILSTKDVLSTDKEKVSTDRPIVSTDGSKVSTDRQIEGTDEQIEGTEEQIESTDGQRKGTEDHTEEGTKAVSKEKEKGVELKDIEETDRPKPTSTRSLLTLRPLPKIDPKDKGNKKIEKEDETDSESDDVPQAEKKFKQLESDEEMARKIQEEWEAEEERNRIAEEKATNEALIRNFDDKKGKN